MNVSLQHHFSFYSTSFASHFISTMGLDDSKHSALTVASLAFQMTIFPDVSADARLSE